MPARSYLYVPGDAPDKLARAFERGADAVILDLEDGVRPAAKAPARTLVGELLRGPAAGPGRAGRYVRVNLPELAADIDAVVTTGLTGIVVPKATPAVLRAAGPVENRAESTAGLAPGTVGLIPLIESAAGLLGAVEMATMARVLRLGLGEADLSADLGLRPGPDRTELLSLRLHIVVASAAAGIAAPIGPAHLWLSTMEDLAESTRRLLALGFRARTAIHPRQIDPINEAFAPTPDEADAARETIAVFEAAHGGGGLRSDGGFVDLAVVRSAREVLDRWDLADATRRSTPPSDGPLA